MSPLRALPSLSIVFAFLLCFAVACGGSGSDKPGHYKSEVAGHSFQYPSDWPNLGDEVKFVAKSGEADVVDDVAFGSVDPEHKLHSGVQVIVVRVKEPVAPDNLETGLETLDESFQELASGVAGRLRPPEMVQLGGQTARQWIIEFVYAGQVQAANVQTVTFVDDLEFVVSCIGPAETFDADILPGCEQVLQTFKLS